jgi:PAS domain-containing protein
MLKAEHGERVFLRVNRRFEALFGVPASTVLGRRFDDLQGLFANIFADAAAFGATIANSAAGGSTGRQGRRPGCGTDHPFVRMLG